MRWRTPAELSSRVPQRELPPEAVAADSHLIEAEASDSYLTEASRHNNGRIPWPLPPFALFSCVHRDLKLDPGWTTMRTDSPVCSLPVVVVVMSNNYGSQNIF